ncbi:thioredoxin domain-containing protein [bacterium]|nr:thioredoxin domain-containing protein [bacterium]
MLDAIKEQLNNLSKGQLITLLVGCVLVLALSLYYLYNCIKSGQVEYFEENSDFSEEMEMEGFSNNDVVIRMFYVDWCGYCKKAKPGYMQFMKNYNESTHSGKNVRVEMINCEENEANAQLAAKFGVKGYPTIIAVVNGEKKTYEGADRSENGFVSWLKSLF